MFDKIHFSLFEILAAPRCDRVDRKIVFQVDCLALEPFLDLLDSMSVFYAKLGFENLRSKVGDSRQIYVENCRSVLICNQMLQIRCRVYEKCVVSNV